MDSDRVKTDFIKIRDTLLLDANCTIGSGSNTIVGIKTAKIFQHHIDGYGEKNITGFHIRVLIDEWLATFSTLPVPGEKIIVDGNEYTIENVIYDTLDTIMKLEISDFAER